MLVSPEERFVRLRIEPEQAARLAHRLTGGTTGGEPEGDLLPILETFAQQGLLADRPAAVSPLTGRHVLVRGGGPVAATVTRLLRAAGVGRVTERDAGALPVSTVDAPHAVIACAGWLPDADWLRLDAWCAGHGIVWTGCHAEGLRFHLGPLAIPGRTAGYADVRARRLAAARHPAELEAWWRHLDGGRDVPAVPWPEPAALAALAAALAADVLAWLSGRPLPHEGVQLAFDPVRWDWTRHPVLPVPRNLMQEPAA